MNTSSIVLSLTSNSIYEDFFAEREEILKHKWIESEKIGKDIGFDTALFDWIIKYRSAWRSFRKSQKKYLV